MALLQLSLPTVSGSTDVRAQNGQYGEEHRQFRLGNYSANRSRDIGVELDLESKLKLEGWHLEY
jgi:hypothetical protein